MIWLNIHVSKLDGPEFLGSEPTDRATWLCLQRFCIGQENGGRIADCRDWKDRKWQQLLGITEAEAKRSCDLWTWDENDLVVWGYDCPKEAEVIAKREAGRKGGRAKSEAKTKAVSENGKAGGRPKTKAEPKLETKAEPKLNLSENQTERKGKERKGIGTHTARARDGSTGDNSDNPPCTIEQAVSVAGENAISEDCARQWWLVHDARGWVDTKGNQLLHWHSSLVAYGQTWRRKETENHGRKKPIIGDQSDATRYAGNAGY